MVLGDLRSAGRKAPPVAAKRAVSYEFSVSSDLSLPSGCIFAVSPSSSHCASRPHGRCMVAWLSPVLRSSLVRLPCNGRGGSWSTTTALDWIHGPWCRTMGSISKLGFLKKREDMCRVRSMYNYTIGKHTKSVRQVISRHVIWQKLKLII